MKRLDFLLIIFLIVPAAVFSVIGQVNVCQCYPQSSSLSAILDYLFAFLVVNPVILFAQFGFGLSRIRSILFAIIEFVAYFTALQIFVYFPPSYPGFYALISIVPVAVVIIGGYFMRSIAPRGISSEDGGTLSLGSE